MTSGDGPFDEPSRPAFPALRPAAGGVVTSSEPSVLREMASLRKRLFAPAWWCEGILVKHGGKDPLTQAMAARAPQRLVVSSPPCAAKQFPLLFSVWNELVAQALAGRGSARLVRVPLDRFLRGTSIDIADSVRFLETYWSSPFQVRGARSLSASGTTRKGKAATLKPGTGSGAVNFVRYCTVETGESPALVMELALPLADFVGGRLERVLPAFLCEDAFASKGTNTRAADVSLVAPGVVSANPDVLRAFGSTVSLRKLVAYLYVEFAKAGVADVFDCQGWHGRALTPRELGGLHEGLLQRTTALYDHGVFGWENTAPRARIRDVAGGGGGVVHCWRLSQNARYAAELEQTFRDRIECVADSGAIVLARPPNGAVSTSTIPTRFDGVGASAEAARPYLSTVLSMPQRAGAVVAPVTVTAPAAPNVAATVTASAPVTRRVETSTSEMRRTPVVPRAFDAEPVTRAQPAAPLALGSDSGDDDHDLMLCVLEYYSSLPPRQQRLFQTQKARMTDAEFRAYVLPLLGKSRARQV